MSEEGKKYDEGKPMLAGILGSMKIPLEQVTLCGMYGMDKYKEVWGNCNWQLVDRGEERYADALYRHLMAYLSGEWLDPESGLPHVSHIAWNGLTLCFFALRKRNTPEGKTDGK